VFLLSLLGQGFKLLALDIEPPGNIGLPAVRIGAAGYADPGGFAAERLGRNVLYLVRPDQHIAARFTAPTYEAVTLALARARGFRSAVSQVAA
jgi:3-(3-hydroxy-phenyl)propionate hydroxylase